MRGAISSVPALASVLVWAACDFAQPTGPSPLLEPSPALAISDAANGAGGAPYFSWLPPIARQPASDGTFDPTAEPTVTICVLDPTQAPPWCDPLAPRYEATTTAGLGGETVGVAVRGGHYHLNWHTDRFPLPAGLGRVSVSVEGALLGYVDVLIGATGRSIASSNTQEAIPLVDGRTLPIKFRIDAWDPDIVFLSTRDGFMDVYLTDPSGWSPSRLTFDPFPDRDPQWSPDGTKIVFTSPLPDGLWKLWVIDLTTGRRSPLTHTSIPNPPVPPPPFPRHDFSPSWAPDGNTIVFERQRPDLPERPDIWVVMADGSAEWPLTDTPFHMDEDPEWSPDGTSIVFERKCEPYGFVCRAGDDGEIWVMDADGANARSLIAMTGEEVWAGNPAFSPDGRRIAFSAGVQEDDDDDNRWDLYLADADGTGVVRLLESAFDDVDPSWSPDGAQLLFTRVTREPAMDFEVFIMDAAAGSDPTPLITSPGLDALARWRR
jgi:Tol biopolymer transport system component